MSALSIRNMNWTVGQMEAIRAEADRTPTRSIEDQLLGSLEFLQTAKTREMKWSQNRKDGKTACMFCKLAVGFHKQELSVRDQILLIASIGCEPSPIIYGGEIVDRNPISQPEIIEANAVSDAFNLDLVQEVEF